MQMIDAVLEKKARPVSPEIISIDDSWREYVEKIRAVLLRMPFQGKYNAVVDDETVLVEGYAGPLVINRLTGGGTTYALVEPIRCDPFRIYGVWDIKGCFDCFTSLPVLGFHYAGTTRNGALRICTGDVDYVNPTDVDSLKEVCTKIAHSFTVIYIGSLGQIVVPKKHGRLKEILQSESTRGNQIAKLLEENLIREIL